VIRHVSSRLYAAKAALIAPLLLSACATAPTHPALQSAPLPELIPVRRVVANVDLAAGFLLSPDGRHVLWSQAVGLDVGLAVRAIDRPGTIRDTPDRRFATGHLARPFGLNNFGWLADSRHAYYYKDLSGAENTQIVIFDTQADIFEPWVVTPWPGARSFLLDDGSPGSARVLFASNRRDRSTFDVFEADLTTRQIREIERSDGRVLWWIVDTEGKLAGRVRQLGEEDGSDQLLEIAEDSAMPPTQWRMLRKIGGFDAGWPLRLDRKARRLYALSNIGRDKVALVEVDLSNDAERVLFEHPRVDVGQVFMQRSQGEPYAAVTEPDYPRIDYLDNAVGKDMQAAVERAIGLAHKQGLVAADLVFARPSTVSENGQRLIVRGFSYAGNSELLYDRATDTVTPLRTPVADAAALLVPMAPYAFKASDGLEISGYLLRPKGVSRPGPLVVHIHGGPWTRDRWAAGEFDAMQLLANRGYAVIKVNYRGSGGYGRQFMAAGARVTATRLQQDIAEAAQWAVGQGIADPQRIAVMGGSFGGFSTLMQLIDQPHPYACGVDIVGVAHWPRVFETWPPFWRNRHYFKWFYGDIADPVERAAMWQGSPLSRIDRITAPLLVIHGANDVRVVKQDSDDVVAELTKLNRPVEYLVFDNEGHQVRRWRNRLAMWRTIEDFLAGCLGGRSGGFDYYELMPR
jgi:dipeptidyl aminopeptidase/acylaminoacyl peptidase